MIQNRAIAHVLVLLLVIIGFSASFAFAFEALYYDDNFGCTSPSANFCSIQLTFTHPEIAHPRNDTKDKSYLDLDLAFSENIHLPFNPVDLGVDVIPNSRFPTQCQIVTTTSTSAVLRVRSNFYYLAKQRFPNATTLSADDMKTLAATYLTTTRSVKCDFVLMKEMYITFPGQQYSLTRRNVDGIALEDTGYFLTTPTPTPPPPATLPPFLYYPAINTFQDVATNGGDNSLHFTPTSFSCTNEYSNAPCTGSLLNLPTPWFPYYLETLHTVEVLGMTKNGILSSPQCPLVITEIAVPNTQPFLSTYKLDLNITALADLSQPFVHCHRLFFNKQSFSGITIYAQKSPDDTRTVLYQSHDVAYNNLNVELLSDCFDATDSRCTFVYVFPFTETSPSAAAVVGMSTTVDYVVQDPVTQQYRPVSLAEQAQMGYISWLSVVSPVQAFNPLYPCAYNPYYSRLGFKHPNNLVLCQTLRKSLQTDKWSPSLVYNSTARVVLGGEYLQKQVLYLNFNTLNSQYVNGHAVSYNQYNSVQGYRELLRFPQLVYLAPVMAWFDAERCTNPASDNCKVLFRSQHVGGPLTVTFDQLSTFFLNHRVVSKKCNSLNIDIDEETNSIILPSKKITSHQIHANTEHSNEAWYGAMNEQLLDTYTVLLADPYNPLKGLLYHECEVEYSIKYRSATAVQSANAYNPTINLDLDRLNGAYRHVLMANPYVNHYLATLIRGHIQFDPLYAAQWADASITEVPFSGPSSSMLFIGVPTPYIQGLISAGAIPNVTSIAQFPSAYSTDITQQREHFLRVVRIQEKTLVSRPSLELKTNIHPISHPQLFTNRVVVNKTPITTGPDFVMSLDPNALPVYAYTFSLRPVIARHNVLLFNSTSDPTNCASRVTSECTVFFTWMSQHEMAEIGVPTGEQKIKSFSVVIENANTDWMLVNRFQVNISNLIAENIVVTTTQTISWNDLHDIWGVSPVISPQFALAPMFYAKVPQFDKTAKIYTVLSFEVTSDPIPIDPAAPIVVTLTYPKQYEHTATTSFGNIRPTLLTYGGIFDPSNLPNNFFNVVDQPVDKLGAYECPFLPDLSLEFSSDCTNPRIPQCRIFAHRRVFDVPVVYIGISEDGSWAAEPLGLQGFEHPYYTPMYRKKLYPIPLNLANTTPVVPIVVNLLPKAPESWNLEFDIIEFPPGVMFPDVFGVPPLRVFQYYKVVAFETPTVPNFLPNCKQHDDQLCTIRYTITGPTYGHLDAPKDHIFARHALVSGEYLFVDSTRFLPPTANSTIRTFVPDFEVFINDQADVAAAAKFEVKIELDSALVNPELTLTITLKNPRAPDGTPIPTPILLAGPDNDAIIRVEVRLVKNGNVLSHAVRVKPEVYNAIPLVGEHAARILAISDITIPGGLGYRPFSVSTGPGCTQSLPLSQSHAWHCELAVHLVGSPANPIPPMARLLHWRMPAQTSFPPLGAIYLHTIPLPVSVTTLTPHYREQYKKYECGNITQIWFNFDDVDRRTLIVNLEEEYRRQTKTCYISLDHSAFVDAYRGQLITQFRPIYPWFQELQDTWNNPSMEISLHPNLSFLLPPLEAIYVPEAFGYILTDFHVPGLEAAGFPVQILRQQILDEIALEDQATAYINGIPQLPTYYPRFVLNAMIDGPIVEFFYTRQRFLLPNAFLYGLGEYASGKKEVDFVVESVSERQSTSAFDVTQMVMYQYNFTANLGDFHIENDVGMGLNGRFPCVEPPTPTSTFRLNLTDYLIYAALIQAQQPVEMTPETANFARPVALAALPPHHPLNNASNTNILGIFHTDQAVDPRHRRDEAANGDPTTTRGYPLRMLFNRHKYINSQLTTQYNAVDPEILNAELRDYVDPQLQAATPKPTIRNKLCYFYAPFVNYAPRYSEAVQHRGVVILDGRYTTSATTQFQQTSIAYDYPKYYQNAHVVQNVEAQNAAYSTHTTSSALLIGVLTTIAALVVVYF